MKLKKLVKIVSCFSTVLVNISLENYFSGGISVYASYMFGSEKEDLIRLYFNQNACAKSHLQGQSLISELLIGTERTDRMNPCRAIMAL